MIPLDARLLAAVLAEPDNDALRLVSADWWEEQGEAERAEFVRVQIELAMREGYAGADRSRWSDELKRRMEKLYSREQELLTLSVEQRWPDYAPGIPCWLNADSTVTVHREAGARSVYSSTVAFRRGFVHALTCTAADWIAHADAIRAQNPVQAVTLTTWPGNDNGSSCIIRFGDTISRCTASVREFRTQAALNRIWHGIDFTLPPDAGGFPVPPMFDNALLMSALHGGDAIPSMRLEQARLDRLVLEGDPAAARPLGIMSAPKRKQPALPDPRPPKQGR